MTRSATAAPPKERPILFSGPEVRAILDGNKTQTRRVVKDIAGADSGTPYWPGMVHGGDFLRPEHCPHGSPGDRLWLKETHWYRKGDGCVMYAQRNRSLQSAALTSGL